MEDLDHLWGLIDFRDPRVLICRRNIELRDDLKNSSLSIAAATRDHSEIHQLMEYLDRSGISLNLERCWEEFSKPLSCTAGVDFLCRWAVTPLRPGTHRVFFAARLISLITAAGIDVQSTILNFLQKFEREEVPSDVHILMSELVRRRRFSVPDYLRLLIASGSLSMYQCSSNVHLSHSSFYFITC